MFLSSELYSLRICRDDPGYIIDEGLSLFTCLDIPTSGMLITHFPIDAAVSCVHLCMFRQRVLVIFFAEEK